MIWVRVWGKPRCNNCGEKKQFLEDQLMTCNPRVPNGILQIVGGSQDRVVSKRVVLADVPWTHKTRMRAQNNKWQYEKRERGHKDGNDGTKNRNEGTLAKTTINCKTARSCVLSLKKKQEKYAKEKSILPTTGPNNPSVPNGILRIAWGKIQRKSLCFCSCCLLLPWQPIPP